MRTENGLHVDLTKNEFLDKSKIKYYTDCNREKDI